jgi:ribosomal protein S18 acetylase RimI-like enzyme
VDEVEDAVALRAAGPGDEAFLRELYAGGRRAELALTPWSEVEKRAFCDMQYALQDRHYRVHFGGEPLVITVAGTDAGRVYRALSGDTLTLLDIALVEEMRGRGAGTQLMRAIQADAAREGRRIVLHVEEDSRVARWYERLGFRRSELLGTHREMTWDPRHPDAEADLAR